MTLQEAIAAVTALAPKSPGQLIKTGDWNALVESVVTIGTLVADNQTRLDSVEAAADSLRADLDTATARIGDLENRVDTLAPLLDNYLVRTSCERINFAMGEVCVLTAEVTDLEGSVLQERPWVDFFASWGRLRSVPGFNSRAGVGDNSLSVQVDAAGIAQVQLRADHTEGFTDTEEAEVANSLQIQLQNSNFSVAQALLNATSPTEFTARSAFTAMTLEYERTDSNALSNFVDTYFVRKPPYQILPTRPNFIGRWRDYRATVMAMAKPDSDPTTADFSRGASSIQITFRDWISNWINDYVLDIGPAVQRLNPLITPLFAAPLPDPEPFEHLLGSELLNKGIVGRMKTYEAFGGAMDQIGGADSSPFIRQAANAVRMQSASDVTQGIYAVNNNVARSTPAASSVLGGQKQSNTLGGEVAGLAAQVADTSSLSQSISVMEGRLQAAESVGVNIDQRLNIINDNVRSINVFDDSSIQSGVNSINAEIQLIRNRLGR